MFKRVVPLPPKIMPDVVVPTIPRLERPVIEAPALVRAVNVTVPPETE